MKRPPRLFQRPVSARPACGVLELLYPSQLEVGYRLAVWPATGCPLLLCEVAPGRASITDLFSFDPHGDRSEHAFAAIESVVFWSRDPLGRFPDDWRALGADSRLFGVADAA